MNDPQVFGLSEAQTIGYLIQFTSILLAGVAVFFTVVSAYVAALNYFIRKAGLEEFKSTVNSVKMANPPEPPASKALSSGFTKQEEIESEHRIAPPKETESDHRIVPPDKPA